jgi:O-antigen/teichoic acid export membrane protein
MKDQNRQYWLKSGSYTLMLNIQSLLFGFGGFYLLVHILDKHHFGVWALFVATVTIFEMVRNGLVQNALIQFLSFHKEEDHAEILSASFVLGGLIMILCIGVNIAIAGFLSRLWHYPQLASMFYLYSIVYILQGFLAQFQWIEQARLSFKGILYSTTLRQAGFFGYLVYCFFTHYTPTLVRLIYVTGFFTLAGAMLQYIYVRRYLSFPFTYRLSWITKMFHYGKYVLATSISGIITNTVNQMMLGTLMSPDAAGVYNVAIKITNLADIPTNALGTIVFPQSSKRFASEGREASKYLYEKSVGSLLALLIPFVVVFFLFPSFVVRVIAGGKYADAVPLIQITMLTCIFNPFARLFGTILDSIGKTRYNFYVIVFFLISEIVLNYFMIRQMGLMGAIYATLIANIIFFGVMQVILRRELRVNLLHVFVYASRFYPEFWKTYVKPAFSR